jgi:acyl-CoA dehydrogenase
MRSIGMAERAVELMCQRTLSRTAFGKPIAEQGVVQDWIAEARVRIEQLRLLVLKTAWLMDTVGNRGAHTEIQAIKIATPSTVEWILDKAIQAHGGGGVSQDFPLAQMWAHMRTLRLAGPVTRARGCALRLSHECATTAVGGLAEPPGDALNEDS